MIKAPFNFVPLADKVFFPDWAEQVSQDCPFSDGEDGIIELQLTNCTPLFTRDGSRRNETSPYSAHIETEEGKRYYIPGTTIKGCVRSVMEILSFAKMGPYNNSSFAMPREFDTKKSTNSTYMEKTKKVFCGWLVKEGDDDQVPYRIYQCKKGVQKISVKALKRRFSNFDEGADHETAERKQRSLQCDGELYPTIMVEAETISYKENNNEKWVPEGEYQVVCTGHMTGKNHEYLFSTSLDAPIPVSKQTFDVFDSVHSKTEYYNGHGGNPGFLKTRLRTGLRIPVFFTKNSQGGVDAIGIAYKLRYPYSQSISKAVNRCYIEAPDPNKPDLPEVIFGYIDKQQTALRGRVSFGHAFCDSVIPDEQLITQAGVLGQPSASYYPLYLQQTRSPYQSYKDPDCRIAGRKRYRIIRGNQTNALPEGNGNENCLSTFQSLPYGQTFKCRISVHNLRKAEIGALLSAITMHNTDGTFLNLGLAKSFGFGKMSCRLQLNGFKSQFEDYLLAFEKALAEEGFELNLSTNLNQLIAIASEHEASAMTMMADPQEYEENKNNQQFSTLTEASRHIQALLSHDEAAQIYRDYQESRILRTQEAKAQEEALRREKEEALKAEEQRKRQLSLLQQIFESINVHINAGNWKDALEQIQRWKDLAATLNEPTDKIEPLVTLVQSKLEQKSGLNILNEQFPDGRFKVTDFKGIKNRTDTWLKKSKLSSIPQEEQNELYTALLRAKSEAKKKEISDFAKPDSSIWQYIQKVTSSEVASTWFSSINQQ